ncbi:NAD(P)-binding protein [Lentithecium fluviatile CBS 122367]|uniref:NAD(P)-binding protein n=1 Tax=Lentithecium fluviatile CBS 122367 TaxID=1168545 RepID=A0A6G1JML8_9PLEO|nr:NAD(P)-binding protein [Lentithecium fluviatile CBS 122367]
MAPLVWLITGTSSGLGHSLVHAILARGDHCIATARSLLSISSLASAGASTLALDVTAPFPIIQATINAAISIHGHIDVLVNNAGYIVIGTVEGLDEEEWRGQFETNVFGAVKVAKAVLPHFRGRRSGTVAFVGSLSGWVGHEACGAYAGSKFALEGIAESLHRETSHLDIRTLLIEPGRFRTKLLSASNMHTHTRTPSSTIPDYATMLDAKMEGLANEDGAQLGDPEKLAEVVVDLVKGNGVAKGRRVPLRVALGTDCVDGIKEKCEETLRELGDWEGVGRSMGFGS